MCSRGADTSAVDDRGRAPKRLASRKEISNLLAAKETESKVQSNSRRTVTFLRGSGCDQPAACRCNDVPLHVQHVLPPGLYTSYALAPTSQIVRIRRLSASRTVSPQYAIVKCRVVVGRFWCRRPGVCGLACRRLVPLHVSLSPSPPPPPPSTTVLHPRVRSGRTVRPFNRFFFAGRTRRTQARRVP